MRVEPKMADYQSALDAVLAQLRRKGMEARGRLEPVEGEPIPKIVVEYKPPKAAEFIVINLDSKDLPDA